MERYCEYKDSGVQWLGEIPSHWEVKRLASYFTERRVKVSDKEFPPLSVTKNGIFPQLENVAKTNDGDNRKLVLEGDFVINSRSDRKGSSGVAKQNGSVSLINIVLQPKKNIYPKFCNYLFKCNSFIEEYYRNGRGIVADLWTTRFDEMKMIKVAVPALFEQKNIADYLDTVTAKIDEAIAQQQKMIDLLNERKQIIINQAVTKGLDPNVPMKDSGVDWIGEIPEHWKIFSLKHIATFVNGYAFNSDTFNKGEGRKLPVFRISNIGGEGISFNDIVFVECKSIFDNYLVQKDDLLIAMSGATTGKICKVKNEVGYINQRVGIIRSRYSEWIYYNLENYLFKSYIFFLALGSAQPNVASNKIMSYKICIPSQAERQKIIKYIKGRANVIDNAIMKCRKQIFLLQERKQIIINGVVTGKVKVS